MTASSIPAGTVVVVPAPRAASSSSSGPALPRIPVPTPRTPVDRWTADDADDTAGTDPRPATGGRHHAAPAMDARAARAPRSGRRDTIARAVTIAARTGSVVTLGAMLVVAAAAAGLSDGHAPTGAAAAVANTTLR